MKRFIYGPLALLAIASLALCQEPTDKDVPYQALEEIARRGDMVERVDGYQDAGDPSAAKAEALAVPADDSCKWHITLVTKRGCSACERLKADFAAAPVLAPWVNVGDYKKSWAHYQVIDIDDATQKWRWKDFQPTSFPTLIVQPPYNGSWGDPHTVVLLRTGYDGNPAKLEQALKAAIEKYAAAVYPRKLASDARRGVAPLLAGMRQTGGPPFFPISPQPTPTPPSYPVQIPPEQPSTSPSSFGLWATLIGGLLGLGGTNLVGIGLAVWALIRKTRQAAGQPVLPEATYTELVELLKSLKAKP